MSRYLWNMYILPTPQLGPMCCLPLIRCTVHRPCCMIGSKEKGISAPPGAMPTLTIIIIIPVQRVALLQGHYRTHSFC